MAATLTVTGESSLINRKYSRTVPTFGYRTITVSANYGSTGAPYECELNGIHVVIPVNTASSVPKDVACMLVDLGIAS